MKANTTYACVWIVTAVAIIAGLYITKDANCIWGFFFPLCINFHSETISK